MRYTVKKRLAVFPTPAGMSSYQTFPVVWNAVHTGEFLEIKSRSEFHRRARRALSEPDPSQSRNCPPTQFKCDVQLCKLAKKMKKPRTFYCHCFSLELGLCLRPLCMFCKAPPHLLPPLELNSSARLKIPHGCELQ